MDGTGSPWYSGDIGIRDGRIAAIGNLSAAARKRTIDAKGKVVAPGFIDMLGQSETTILVDPRLPSKIYQGITTEITGEGGSAAPLNDTIIANDRPGYAHYKVDPDWRTFRQYFARLEKQGMGINLASYVGATQVRRMVLGDADVQPTPEQLEKMKALVREAMRDGAVGVSTSLEYAPAPYAKTEEIIALASEASKFGGIYATHMRNEGDSVLEGDRRSRSHRTRGAHSGGDLAFQSGGQSQLGTHARVDGAGQQGARRRRRHFGRHLRLHRVVQQHVGLCSAVGARRRRCQVDRAAEGSRNARPHSQRYGDAFQRLGQRVAGNQRPAGRDDRRGSESRAEEISRQAPHRSRRDVEQRPDGRALRSAHRRQGVHRLRGLWHVRARRGAGLAAAVGFRG